MSGGTQFGLVLQGRDFSNLTFGAAPGPITDKRRRGLINRTDRLQDSSQGWAFLAATGACTRLPAVIP